MSDSVFNFFSLQDNSRSTVWLFGAVIVISLCFLGVSSAHGQEDTGRLQELRKQLNKIQQELVDRQKQTNSTLSRQPETRISRNDSLFSKRHLQHGDRGQAVKNLQAALNAVPNLAVSESGPGSVGAETTYFGSKTYRAVTAFQARYKQDILTPLGLSSPTGVVGPRTKEKLLRVIGEFNVDNSVGQSSGTRQSNDTNPGEITQLNSSQNNELNDADSLAELRSQFTLDKWSFTPEEKQKIYDLMPPEVQKKHFDGFLDGADSNYQDNSDYQDDSANPLQDRYQQLQNNNETSLKEQLKGYLALQQLKAPLGLLKKTLSDVFEPKTAHAQGVFIFGGRIASVEPCPTPPNALQVTVAGPRPGRFAFIPGASQIRPAYNVVPRPAMNTLGNYAPVPGCYGPPPAVAPLTQGTIILMGVSQI